VTWASINQLGMDWFLAAQATQGSRQTVHASVAVLLRTRMEKTRTHCRLTAAAISWYCGLRAFTKCLRRTQGCHDSPIDPLQPHAICMHM
jgi:hypothetical protein